MPSGGGSQNSTVTNTTQLPSWAQPYANQYLTDVSGQVSQDLASGYPAGMNQQVAPMTALQNAGINQGVSAALGTEPMLGTAENTAQNIESGAMLNPSSNPYLAAAANGANQLTVQQYQDATEPGIQAEFADAGSFGGSAQQNAESQAQANLGQSLANSNANIFNQDYQLGSQQMIQEQAMIPNLTTAALTPSQELSSLGQEQQTQNQDVLNANQANATNQFNYPYELYGELGGALPTAIGGTGTSTQVGPNPSYINPLEAGLGLGGAALGGLGATALGGSPGLGAGLGGLAGVLFGLL